MFELEPALRWIVENDGSDLHLKVKSLPLARINGSLHKLDQWDVLQEEDTVRTVREMLVSNPDKWAEFERDPEVGGSHAGPALPCLQRRRHLPRAAPPQGRQR